MTGAPAQLGMRLPAIGLDRLGFEPVGERSGHPDRRAVIRKNLGRRA
jgi:hypothetical protein